MGDVFVYTLDLPHAVLNPNKKSHANRGQVIRLTREYKRHAYIRAICSNRPPEPLEFGYLVAKFYHPVRRKRDRDNLNGSLKAAIDGIVLAGVIVDDSELVPLPPEQHIDTENPRVELHVSRLHPSERTRKNV